MQQNDLAPADLTGCQNMSERPEVKAVQAHATAINSTIASGRSIQSYAQKLAEEGFIDDAIMFLTAGDFTDGTCILDTDHVNKLTDAVVAVLITTTKPVDKFMAYLSVVGEAAGELVNQITEDYVEFGGTNLANCDHLKLSDEYYRVASKRVEIVDFLAASVSPERLADRLLVQNLLCEDIRQQVLVPVLTKSEKVRCMIDAVIARIKLHPANYEKFMSLLKEYGSLEDLIRLIDS